VCATPARNTDSLPGKQSGVTEGETHMIERINFKELNDWFDIPLKKDITKKEFEEIYNWVEENAEYDYIVGFAYVSFQDEQDAFTFSMNFGVG
jgi:hypothetical protein